MRRRIYTPARSAHAARGTSTMIELRGPEDARALNPRARTRTVWRALALAVVVVGGGLFVSANLGNDQGATVTAPAVAPSRDVPTAASPADDELTGWLDAVKTINTTNSQTRQAAGPLALAADRSEANVIAQWRDVDESPVPNGRYHLVIYCAGEGGVHAAIAIGARTSAGDLSCDPTTSALQLSITGGGHPSSIDLTPLGTSAVAVAYRLDRM